MNYSQIEKYRIFEKTKVGFEFEFFSDLKSSEIAKIFKRKLSKKILLGNGKTYIKGKGLGYHTKTSVSSTEFKLEKDYSGGPMMYELITGPLSYFEASKLMFIALKTIHEIGWTNNNSSLHINLSFDDKECQIMFINVLKFCLNFYRLEKEIFKDFPSRKNNMYTESITRLLPDISTLTFEPEDVRIENVKVKLPTDSRYFGVNFQKMKLENYIEFRYIGGEGYVKKLDRIKYFLDEFILFSYTMATNRNITADDEKKFQILMRAYYERMKFFENIETFKSRFENDIILMVDLNPTDEYISIRFPEIKDFLYDLIINNGFKEGAINYDSEVHRFQIKDAELKKGILLKDVDFVNCTLSGNFEGCDFWNCEISNSMIYQGHATSCDIEDSKLVDVFSNQLTEYINCFIRNDEERIGGKFKKCIIIGDEGRLLDGSDYDENTLFVDNEYGVKKKK